MTDLENIAVPLPVAGPTRRGVLRAAGVSAAAVALLGACGGDDATSRDEAGSGNDTGASTPATDDTASSAPAGGGGLVATADVPVGSGLILEAEKVVVTQPEAGTFVAFSAVCTHQSCTLAGVKPGGISCACHGSSFAITDGAVQGGPATRPLKKIAVTVEGDQVVRS